MGFYIQKPLHSYSTMFYTVSRLDEIKSEIVLPLKSFLETLNMEIMVRLRRDREVDNLLRDRIRKFISFLDGLAIEIEHLQKNVTEQGCSMKFSAKLRPISKDAFHLVFSPESAKVFRKFIKNFKDVYYVNRVMRSVDDMEISEIFYAIENNKVFISKMLLDIYHFVDTLHDLYES